MKKIGIVTFHNSLNYGAVLQAYALQEILGKNYNASVVNYKSLVMHNENLNFYNRVKKITKSILKWVIFYHRSYLIKTKENRFKDFINNNLNLSSKYNSKTIFKANNEYDAFISGSDQVWNTKLTKRDWNYYLAFADSNKKYSYAASFGGSSILEEDKDKIKNYLGDYQSLLVRESSGKKIITDLGISEKEIEVVSDPVFLLNKEDWVNKLKLEKSNDKYIVLYLVAKQKDLVEYAKSLSKETGYKVKFINLYNEKREDCNEFQNILDAGPQEFLELILNAQYVLTTSFHALAFSLVFNVPFIYELNNEKNNNNSRLENIAKYFNVENYEINSITNPMIYSWKEINEKLSKYQNDSKEILFRSLEDIK